MASRKQRRRRAKGRRHEYEYVYVDEEGHEVEAPPDDEPGRSRDRGAKNGRNGAKVARSKGRTPAREVKPPSWERSFRRAALFLPLFFIVFSLVGKKLSIEWRIAQSVLYSALFVPLTYLMDRTAYRTYLRRSGRQPTAKS
jgi:hypothetical protein